MVNENIKSILEELLFFKDFKQDEIDFLIKNSAFASYNDGEFLLSASQEAKSFYFILSGSVSLQIFSHDVGIVELENIEVGEFLGWSWLTSPYKYHFDAVALKKTKAITFDALAVKKEIVTNHEFGYKMYQMFIPIIVERLQSARKNILELYEKDF